MFNSFLPDTRNQNWINVMKQRYQNPDEYKEHLKEKSDVQWEHAKTGRVSEEMSIKEAQRKKQVAEEKRRREEEARMAEEKRIAKEKRIAEEENSSIRTQFSKSLGLELCSGGSAESFYEEKGRHSGLGLFQFKDLCG